MSRRSSRRAVHADVADQIFAALLIDEAAAGIDAEARHRSLELVVAHVQEVHRGRVRHDAVLADFAADRNDLGNARNRQKLRPQHEIGDLAHLHRRDRVRSVIAISMISPMIDVIGPICGVTPRGSCSLHERQPFRHQLSIAEDVGAPVELDIDDRKTDARYRPHARHARHSVHDALDRKRDELFDLLRREALGLGHQRDDRAVEIGKDVDGNAGQHERAVANKTKRDREDDQPMAQACRDQPIEHGRRLSLIGPG